MVKLGMETKLPEFLQSCLWSYDISEMDKDRDKRLVITQVINYGDKKQLKWMEDNYTHEEIKEVVLHPRRGVWWRDKLRWWIKRFRVMIDPLQFEGAIRENSLRPISLTAEFFKRIDREKNEVARRYS